MNYFKVTFQFKHDGEWKDDCLSNNGEGFSYADARYIADDLKSRGADGLLCREVQVERMLRTYIDKDGNELQDGDIVCYPDGHTKKLYLTEDGELGIDATNPKWVERGWAAECEYGIYPLSATEVKTLVKVS